MSIEYEALVYGVDLLTLDDLIARPAWMADALCAEPAYPSEWWFPKRGQDERRAKRICAECLCRQECLEWSLQQDSSLAGIWAGVSQRGRVQLRRQNPHDRPGASAAA